MEKGCLDRSDKLNGSGLSNLFNWDSGFSYLTITLWLIRYEVFGFMDD